MVDTLHAAVHSSSAGRWSPDALEVRARHAKLVPPRSGGDLVQLVQRTLRESALGARPQQVRFSTSAPQLYGSWDEVGLGRVLDNLLSNAFKYGSPHGVVTVAIAVEQWPAGRFAAVSVADQGIGIPAADLPHLFEWSFRAGNVADIPGTGLGLAASRQTVERLGGSISVVSEEGAGSTFTVRLPLDQ